MTQCPLGCRSHPARVTFLQGFPAAKHIPGVTPDPKRPVHSQAPLTWGWNILAEPGPKLWSWGTTLASAFLLSVREAMAASSQQSPARRKWETVVFVAHSQQMGKL